MELKGYQQRVLSDLKDYLHYVQQHQRIDVAFNQYWEDRIGPYNPLEGKGMKPYQNNLPGTPHVCLKVPTAGGKTFMACNALHTLFQAFGSQQTRAVVWLVPWSNLLQQTINNLRQAHHPYRQKLNSLFNHRVEVYTKEDLLQGSNFNPTVVQDQLSIIVMSFGSLRARKKEDRKVYQENGQLAPFVSQYKGREHVMENTDETALINVIRSLQPVVVLDESHNAETDLSLDMLKGLNPSLVLDLTATPKNNSNIISMVPAIELKKEHMVKLPVIVYNHRDKTEVIKSALHLRHKLEALAQQEEEKGGRYIRPIVLFQAQPKTKADNLTFEKVKEQLVKVGIPEEQIKIKTANKDELKGIDLMSRDCPVRYIITINALKEGWDCPFAYVLASLADRSSPVEVEQILGRVLRQPYVRKHRGTMLNLSYVLTASAKFNNTLQNIVEGLQASGFSGKDYRHKDTMPEETKEAATTDALDDFLFPEESTESTAQDGGEDPDGIDTQRLSFSTDLKADYTPISGKNEVLTEIEELAESQTAEMEAEIAEHEKAPVGTKLYPDMADKVVRYQMLEVFAPQASELKIPRFFLKVPANILFTNGEEWLPLDQKSLLGNFKLSQEDTKIDFEQIASDLYKIDIEKVGKDEYSPRFTKIDGAGVKDPLVDYILAKPKEGQVKDIGHQIIQQIGDMHPIPEQEVRGFVDRILQALNQEQLHHMLVNRYSYARKIKEKVKQHADAHAEERFNDQLKIGQIQTQPVWQFPPVIVPGTPGAAINKSLYQREGKMNQFETSVITELASLPNIVFWHRNLERGKGFAINGYKNNHYPDFFLYTQQGNLIVLETKGDDRDNPDSAAKRRLGHAWANLAGQNFHYFMVYDKISPEGAYNQSKAKELIGLL